MTWRRREVVTGGAALTALAALSVRAAANGENVMANDSDLISWEEFVDQLRPLGQRMMDRLPERLRKDPHVVQESHRLLMSGLMRGITDAIIGDRAHPIFVPELNVAQNIFQPNADTIYKTAMIDGAGRYRLKGDRGTVAMFVMAQLGPDTIRTGKHSPALATHDFHALKLDENGQFDVIVSRTRPDGHDGDWWELHPNAEKFMLRIVGCRWGEEREPRFGIDRLDVDPSKGRLSAADLSARLAEIPGIAANCALAFPNKVEQIRDAGHINSLNVVDFANMSGLQRQSYYEGAYELAEDEALITEVRIPDDVAYWSLILTNELYETTDWYNNQSSLNMAQAHVDADGFFRAVISAGDPGVANWLDTSGYPRGAIQGRWFDTDERPTPSIRKVKLSQVQSELPAGTAMVTPAQRDAAIRERRIKAQMRTIW